MIGRSSRVLWSNLETVGYAKWLEGSNRSPKVLGLVVAERPCGGVAHRRRGSRSRLCQTLSAAAALGRTVRVVSTLQEVRLPYSDTGERLTPVLHFPSRDGLAVQAIRVDYEPGGFTRGKHGHPAGAYVYVIEGSVLFGLDGLEPVVLKAGDSFYEPPGALHSVSRNASDDLPASLIAFFVLAEGESATVYEHD